MALWSAMIECWRASTMHFDEEMGFQYLGPGITVLSASDPRLPTVRFDSIVVLAGGRRRCIGLDGVGFAPSNEDLAFRAGVCHVMNLFLQTMFKLRQGLVQFDFFLATEQKNSFWNDQILEPFWLLFLGWELYQVTAFYHLLDVQRKLGQKKCMFWLSADETSLSNQSER